MNDAQLVDSDILWLECRNLYAQLERTVTTAGRQRQIDACIVTKKQQMRIIDFTIRWNFTKLHARTF